MLPGHVCVDVGANVGYFTLLLGKLVTDQGRVIAFEAHPANVAKLLSNVRLNAYEGRVQVENMAVSDGALKRVDLYPGRGHASGEWNIVGHDVEGNPTEPELEVPATSLDNYFPRGSCVDFVKMDIEGAEGAALRGMRRLLRECKPLILLEFHDESGWAGREELFAANYSLFSFPGLRLVNAARADRVYHCLAVPTGRLSEVERLTANRLENHSPADQAAP